jgi:hypothetical protein
MLLEHRNLESGSCMLLCVDNEIYLSAYRSEYGDFQFRIGVVGVPVTLSFGSLLAEA